DSSLEVFLGDISLPALERPGKRLLEALEDRFNRNLEEARAEILRKRLRVATRLFRRVTGGHREGVNAIRAERLDRQCERQRRVDPARDAHDDLGEPVLLHVVAQTELECQPLLLE